MEILKLYYTGETTYMNEPIYKDFAGTMYVDINLGESETPYIHTVCDPDGYCEADYPVKDFEIISKEEMDIYRTEKINRLFKLYSEKIGVDFEAEPHKSYLLKATEMEQLEYLANLNQQRRNEQKISTS